MTHRPHVAVLAACAGALMVPPLATAAEVHVEGSTVVYTAGPGENNALRLGGVGFPADKFAFTDPDPATVVSAPCTRELDTMIMCPAAGLTGARFTLGDGDDAIRSDDDGVTTATLPVIVSAGAGDDTIAGTSLGDLIDGGDGKDDLAGGGGDNVVTGGAGNDDVIGGNDRDDLDGGPGKDFVNGGAGNDEVRAGTGAGDELIGSDGDDQVDMRNGEVDVGEATCSKGDDTILLDPRDRVLEYQRPGSKAWTVEPTCEHVKGQTRAPKPLGVFGSSRSFYVDAINALPATIKVEVFHNRRLVARGTTRHKAGRTRVPLRKTPAGRRVRTLSFLSTVTRVTITDTGGRRSVTSRIVNIVGW